MYREAEKILVTGPSNEPPINMFFMRQRWKLGATFGWVVGYPAFTKMYQLSLLKGDCVFMVT